MLHDLIVLAGWFWGSVRGHTRRNHIMKLRCASMSAIRANFALNLLFSPLSIGQARRIGWNEQCGSLGVWTSAALVGSLENENENENEDENENENEINTSARVQFYSSRYTRPTYKQRSLRLLYCCSLDNSISRASTGMQATTCSVRKSQQQDVEEKARSLIENASRVSQSTLPRPPVSIFREVQSWPRAILVAFLLSK